ncbi:MAG: hypothetical protein JWN78_1832 [Bacteroidota bacterium]|nr:hypothetical protein [Bacteroidota bacterium]
MCFGTAIALPIKTICMKKIFTLALSIVMCSSIFAAAEFFVKINSNGNYTVSLNNQSMNSSSNIYRFFDLYPGNYSLKIFENSINGRLIYDRPVTISDGYRTVAELDVSRGLNIIDKIPFVQKSWYIDNLLQPSTGYGTPHAAYPPVCPPPPVCGNGYNNPKGNHGHQNGQGNYDPNNNPNNNYPGNGNYGYGNMLDDASLQSLIQTMKNVTFEEKMIEVAKTALKNRQVRTSQVHQLLQLFSFETNKLEVAKFCYDKTADKNNYYSLYNDFTFSSYSSELDKYINSR